MPADVYVAIGPDGSMDYQKLQITACGCLKVITNSHLATHEGRMFSGFDIATLNNTNAKRYKILATGYDVHATIDVFSNGVTTASLYEAATGVTVTTNYPMYNANRTSASVSPISIDLVNAYTGLGTKLDSKTIGNSTGAGDSSIFTPRIHEWILKADTVYVFEIISGSNGNTVSVGFNMYRAAV